MRDNRRTSAFEGSGYELRCPVCEGLDYPGLTHNPDAPYCSENPAVRDNRRSGALLVLVLALVLAAPAGAHYQPGRHNAIHAIQLHWCGKANRVCWQGNEAIHVANCETGGTFSTVARNGQYQGLFQMGTSERRTYGHGPDPWSQARAAHYYWTVSGRDWSPWDPVCRP